MSIGSFMFFASFNMVLPELPNYLKSIGGKDYVWMYVGAFAIVALISRPFSGRLADTIGRVPVMLFGAMICLITSSLYPFVNTIVFFFSLRMIHGFSAGFTPTGSTAYIDDIVPSTRRGEAMGIVGIINNLGMSLGPALGAFITLQTSLNTMFVTSALFAATSLGIFLTMKETLKNKQKFSPKLLKLKKADVFEPRVWLPSAIMLLCVIPAGVVLTVYPDMSDALGLKNKGIFVTIFTLASISMRFGAGKLSDRIGRRVVTFWGCTMLLLSMICLALTHSVLLFIISALLYGFAFGILSPTLFAWAADLSVPENKGRGISTLFMALEAGIVLGSLLLKLFNKGAFNHLPLTFCVCGICVIIAIILLQLNKYYPKGWIKSQLQAQL